jgi:hypothetical protein
VAATVSHSVVARYPGISLRCLCALVIALFAIACTDSPDASDAEKPKDVSAELCQLVIDGKVNDGRRVRVRAAFGSGVDFVRLFDQSCPSYSVFVRGMRDEVDVTLCRSDALADKYGCPVNGESGVRATFTGIYHYSSKMYGRLDVDEMADISTAK